MKKTIQITAKIALAGLFLASLSGCGIIDKIKEIFGGDKKTSFTVAGSIDAIDKEELGKVLVLIKGEPVVYEKEFKAYLGQMLQMYPQLKGLMTIDSLPAPMKKNVLQKLADQKLITKFWAKEANVEQSEEFQKSLNEALEMIKDHLTIQFFEKEVIKAIEVRDAEVRAEFDKNKEKFIKAPGGVAVLGVKFDKAGDATAFVGEIKGKEDNFKDIAEEGTGEFKDFGRINSDSSFPGLPKEIKEASLIISKFPTTKTVKSGSDTWVIYVPEKKEIEYLVFDEVKGNIEEMLRGQKAQESSEKKLEGLRKVYPVEIKEELLEVTIPGEQKEETRPVAVTAA